MSNDILKGKWKQFRGKVKQTWGKLTDDDLDRIDGAQDKLAGRLQERYGYTKEKAEAQIADFLERISIENKNEN
ncbi:MAG: hypothetical protein BGO78_02920 [Chloroflexi bacterium 44-23]|nr:MAG: hypothetical protein BGO78_02920 [Chloroflexi bacterium 44-23]